MESSENVSRWLDLDVGGAGRATLAGRNAMDTINSIRAQPAFDQAMALSRTDGDRAFLCTLASMFVEDSASLIAEIRAAVEEQDGRRLERAAHKLKGSAHPLCATAVTEVAQSLESIGQSGQLTGAAAECRRFEAEMQRLLTALAALTDDEAPPTSATPT
jgi:HPt (histidine-containing phosphotransfer) domain-containing protein